MVQVIEPGLTGSQLLGETIGQSVQQGLGSALTEMFQRRKIERTEKELVSRGYPPGLARLSAVATTGGKTEVIKEVLDQMRRQQTEQSILSQLRPQEQGQFIEEEIQEGRPVQQQIPSESDIGLTPKERISREESRYKVQAPKYEELTDKVNTYDQEGLRINRLKELNKIGKLPKGLQRLNINFETGELRFPFLANAETQEFQKVVNDFLSGAKDSFGARVTNFEVDRFMKRLPGLLNTEKGREAVLRQMEILNRINKIHNEKTLEVIDKAGGIRKIDIDTASRIAKKRAEKEIEALRKDYVGAEKSVKKEEKAGEKPLDRETAQEILKEAKGDKALARKIAKAKGYNL